MRKLTSWGFQKCGSFWVLKVLNQSYWLSKSGENWRKNSKERRCHKKKTRQQFSIFRSVTESAWAQYGWFHADSVTELKIENCGRVFFFWRLVISMTDQFFRTHPSLTAYSSRSKPHTPNKLHIFGKLWTWAFAWSYPGFFFFEQISRNERFMKKLVFLHFFVAAPKKNSSGRWSDNNEDWRLPYSSFRSWRSKFFKTPVKVRDFFKIVGPSPLRSWIIQDRVRQNERF